MRYLVGIDGGGTRTTVVLATADGVELHRHVGPAGLVDPAAPTASARVVVDLVRDAVAKAGVSGPARALCAGLAGVEHEANRTVVRQALEAARLAEQVTVVSDGQAAVEGAMGEGPALLLLAGTGSIAYAKDRAGAVKRCGGWGMVLGDEGSAYGTARSALAAVLHAFDGRGPATSLLAALMSETGATTPRGLPAWAGRASKADVAALTRIVEAEALAGDAVALQLLHAAARALAEHLPPLVAWIAERADNVSPLPLVCFGGMFRIKGFERLTREAVERMLPGITTSHGPAADAATGAVRLAQASFAEATADRTSASQSLAGTA
ncbi:MAG: BadF/BadG/BcrA/BcrD ATPase family protein [Bacteroidota bacterium]